MALLDPKLDVVFKMLFAEPRNEPLLRALLTAVLRPPSPISAVTVLDHWARLFSSRIRRGDSYDRLEPVVCLVFLDARSPGGRFHSTYEAREVHSHAPLSDVLAVHVIELPRLEQASAEGESVELQRWARFLRLDDERELESLAGEAPIMAEAKRALEILSAEPDARRIAEMRREAEIARRLDRAEDLAEGHAQGLAEGRCDMLRRNVEQFCVAFGIELDATRRAALQSLDLTALDALFAQLMRQRAWPL